MVFPIFRKYTNNKSFFIIHSENYWTEFKSTGKIFIKYDFTAIQFPEKLLIKDLIAMVDGVDSSTIEEISALKIKI